MERKLKLQQRKVNDSDIAQSLKRYNAEVHGRGETLPEQQQVFRIKVIKTFLQAGVPLCKVDIFCDLFEETDYRLTDQRFLFDLIPFILEEEKVRIQQQGRRNRGARGAIAPPLFTDHLKIINNSDTQNGSKNILSMQK